MLLHLWVLKALNDQNKTYSGPGHHLVYLLLPSYITGYPGTAGPGCGAKPTFTVAAGLRLPHTMLGKGVPTNIVRWYHRLLRCRNVTAELQGVKRTIRPWKGSHQGGVLSLLE